MTANQNLPVRSKCENRAMHTCTSCILWRGGGEGNKMLALIIMTIVSIAYYEPNNYLTDK